MLRYLALGDSYTIGTGATSPSASFPALLRDRLRDAAGGDVELVNPAVDGYTSEQLASAELPALARARPDLVSLLIGANDVVQGRTAAAYRAALRRIHGAIAAAGVPAGAVLAISIPDWSVTPAAARFGEPAELAARIAGLNDVAREEAAARGARWVDVTDVSRGTGDGWLSADGLHPSDAQYGAWAERIWERAGAAWVAAARAGADGEGPGFGEQGRRLDYGTYLHLHELLALQESLTPAHDELLFIVVHQAYELWFRLILHELEAARDAMARGDAYWPLRQLHRVAVVERLLMAQVDVLDTMAPQEFLRFRSELAPASGFQSVQFREIEFLSGLKDERYLDRIDATAEEAARLRRRLAEATLWDAFRDLLAARGVGSLHDLFWDRPRHGDLFELSEALLDHDQAFSLWRSRHVLMVERQIGAKRGTGGSTGAGYLRTTLDKRFFPELWEIRSRLQLP